MTGIQLSAAWAVVQAAESLAASTSTKERRAGKALRCCEVTSLKKVSEKEKEWGTQGVQVSLQFYDKNDLKSVKECRDKVANCIALALGVWEYAVQIYASLISNSDSWIGASRPTQLSGDGRRLHRYFNKDVIKKLDEIKGLSAQKHLAKGKGKSHKAHKAHKAQVMILLRRLRYRFVQDYGGQNWQQNYAYWTSPMTQRWAKEAGHQLNYIVRYLSEYSDELEFGGADHAESLNIAYSGEIDTERDQLVVAQVTTKGGTTSKDVREVLKRAGSQVKLGEIANFSADKETNEKEPLVPFIKKLEEILDDPSDSLLGGPDVLLIHRGGGVKPRQKYRGQDSSNVEDDHREELLELCEEIRDHGIEVVVAIGHANISVLDRGKEGQLPLGIFEATTPTAGAAWILQEHINPRLVDNSLLYKQGLAT